MQGSITSKHLILYDCHMSKRTKAPPHPALDQVRLQIRNTIRERGYRSVERFAHENGLEQSVLSRFLGGQNDIMLSTYLRIAAALSLNPELEHILENTFRFEKDGALRIDLAEQAKVRIYRDAESSSPAFSIECDENTGSSGMVVKVPLCGKTPLK